MTPLENLFVDTVKASLSSYHNVTKNMLSNTVQCFSEKTPFNQYSFNYWLTVCHNAGVKYNVVNS